MHEYFHAIKRYLSIVTNGLIFSETLDKNDNNEEVGFLFEYFFLVGHMMNISIIIYNIKIIVIYIIKSLMLIQL